MRPANQASPPRHTCIYLGEQLCSSSMGSKLARSLRVEGGGRTRETREAQDVQRTNHEVG